MASDKRPWYVFGTYPTSTGGYRGFSYIDPYGNVYTSGMHMVNGKLLDLDEANSNYSNIQKGFLSSRDGRWRYYNQNFWQDFPEQVPVYIPQNIIDDKEYTFYLSGNNMNEQYTGYNYNGEPYTGSINFIYSPTTPLQRRRMINNAEQRDRASDRALEGYNKYVFNSLTNTR